MMNMNYYRCENTFYALKECIKLMECLKHNEDNSEMAKQNAKRLYKTCKKLKILREKIWQLQKKVLPL